MEGGQKTLSRAYKNQQTEQNLLGPIHLKKKVENRRVAGTSKVGTVFKGTMGL